MIPIIDIYNRNFHQSDAWKDYFESDSIDAELDHPDFINREMIRRKIAQLALNQYTTDMMMFASSNWASEELPGGSSDDEWYRLKVGYDTVEALFIHFHRLE